MDKTFTWTVDTETDWGGRTSGIQGLTDGLPRILETFRAFKVKALFFVSSELALENRGAITRIIEHGHEIGSHGHFHIRYKDKWRSKQDKDISERLLSIFNQKKMEYRAPWFNYETDSLYSKRPHHVSILKQTWFGGRLPENPIFYIHPFDIVKGVNPPNLFTRLLYGKPDAVFDTFKRLVRLYPR